MVLPKIIHRPWWGGREFIAIQIFLIKTNERVTLSLRV